MATQGVEGDRGEEESTAATVARRNLGTQNAAQALVAGAAFFLSSQPGVEPTG